jgi:radial spoke head protein 4A
LTVNEPVISVRFWGKVFGTRANYIVAEVEYQEGEGEEEEEDKESREEESAEGGDDDGELENESTDGERDEPPKSQWKPPPVVPKEEAKTGANKKTYFVCNNREYCKSLQFKK